MGVPYMKVEGDEAYKVLDSVIVTGNKQRDVIVVAYRQFEGSPDSVPSEKIVEWKKIALDWADDVWGKLEAIFISEAELYEFRDAEPPFGATSANIHYSSIVLKMKARINKLTEFRNNIRDRFDVHLEVVQGNKIVQSGAFNSAKVSE
jgi:hypothetical protein